jgi:hypothetical protein
VNDFEANVPIINTNHLMVWVVILWGFLASTSASATALTDQPPPSGCEMAYQHFQTERAATTYNKPAFPPVQLEIRTPFEPTAFQSSGRNYLFYELYLQNFTSTPLTLRGIQVINADNTTPELIAEFNAKQLDALVKPIGGDKMDDNHQLGPGRSAVAFLCVAFDNKRQVPGKLRQRVLLEDAVAVRFSPDNPATEYDLSCHLGAGQVVEERRERVF